MNREEIADPNAVVELSEELMRAKIEDFLQQ